MPAKNQPQPSPVASGSASWDSPVDSAFAYAARLRALKSVHATTPTSTDWAAVRSRPAPERPEYRPGMMGRMLGRTAETDEKYQALLSEHEHAEASWKAGVALAERVLARDPEAYLLAMPALSGNQLGILGTAVRFGAAPDAIEAHLQVHGPNIVPSQIITTLKSGKTSVKAMPIGQVAEIYQDYVCGAVLQMGRMVFARLPVSAVLVNASAPLLDTSTGHLAPTLIVSVLLARTALAALNFALLDPSDAVHRLGGRTGFAKAGRIGAIEPVPWPTSSPAPSDRPAAHTSPAVHQTAGRKAPTPVAPTAQPAKTPSRRPVVAGRSGSTPAREAALPPGGDPGMDAVRRAHAMLQIDPEWCVTEPRGFTWWPDRFCQRVWSEPAAASHGDTVYGVHAAIEIVRDVKDVDRAVAALADRNQLASMAAYVLDAEDRTIWLHTTWTAHADNKWAQVVFATATAIQVTAAKHERERLAQQCAGIVVDTPHPTSGYRDRPDEMTAFYEPGGTFAGERLRSPFEPGDFQAVLEMGKNLWTLATGGETAAMTAEFPFYDDIPAMAIAARGDSGKRPVGTALFQASAETEHPLIGTGLFTRLALPDRFEEADAAWVANALNQAAVARAYDANLWGAWCSRGDDVSYVSFLPSVLAARESPQGRTAFVLNLVVNAALHCRGARELLAEAPPPPTRKRAPRPPARATAADVKKEATQPRKPKTSATPTRGRDPASAPKVTAPADDLHPYVVKLLAKVDRTKSGVIQVPARTLMQSLGHGRRTERVVAEIRAALGAGGLETTLSDSDPRSLDDKVTVSRIGT